MWIEVSFSSTCKLLKHSVRWIFWFQFFLLCHRLLFLNQLGLILGTVLWFMLRLSSSIGEFTVFNHVIARSIRLLYLPLKKLNWIQHRKTLVEATEIYLRSIIMFKILLFLGRWYSCIIWGVFILSGSFGKKLIRPLIFYCNFTLYEVILTIWHWGLGLWFSLASYFLKILSSFMGTLWDILIDNKFLEWIPSFLILLFAGYDHLVLPFQLHKGKGSGEIFPF